jgi:hypothetical protein
MTDPEVAHGGEYKFSDVVDALCDLAPTGMCGSVDEFGGEIELPDWNANMRRALQVSSQVATTTGLGDKVKCGVVGDAETGVALIFRSRNLFNTHRYGFFIQAEPDNGISVWHATAKKRASSDWIGAAMLDYESAQQASPDLADALVADLLSAARK